MITLRMYLSRWYMRTAIMCITVITLYTLGLSSSFSSLDFDGTNPSEHILLAPSTIFLADFENQTGDNAWTLGNGATDGNWIIGQPTPYTTGGNQMEIDAFEGIQVLTTGINNSQDLDVGPAVALSPDIILSATATDIDISFQYYFSHYSNSSSDDNFLIEIRDASNDALLTTLVTEMGDPSLRPAQYVSYQADLTAYAGSTIYIRLSGQDIATGSKVECAIDRVEIIQDDSPTGGPVCGNLITDDFESGYGNWVDGGSDCFLLDDSNFANNGDFSVRLRDNTNSSVMTTGPYELTNVEEVDIDFSYLPVSMETGEDFWLQVSSDGGATYNTVQAWASGTDFTNNVREDENVMLTGPFTNTTLFRFRCDASGNGDLIYLDDIVIDTCSGTAPVACFDLALADTTLCNDMTMSWTPVLSNITVPVDSHLWTVLPSTTASGYTLSGQTTGTLFIDPIGGLPGTLDLSYKAIDDNGCIREVDASIFILGVEPCIIRVDSDTICQSTSAMLDATAIYSVYPDSGIVVSASSGVGATVIHDIIGIQDPSGVKVTITLPTWDDHFAETILNGNTIIPEVFEPDSWGVGGMDIVSPWNANVNGLPRSIVTIENNEVHYYIAQTVNSTAMIEVFPTNWVTTPQNFIPGDNTLQFGIENTAGPVSGSWYLEAEGITDYTYLWTTGDTTNTVDINPTETTTYGVTVTAPNGCSYYCEKTIYVHEFDVTVPDIALCLGGTETHTATIAPDVTGPYIYDWTLLNGPSGVLLTNSDAAEVTIDAVGAVASGFASIKYSATDKFGCTAVDTFMVEVVNIPTLTCLSKIDEGSWMSGVCTIEACEGSTINFGVDSTLSNVSWSGPNGFSSSSPIISISDLHIVQEGIYTVDYVLGSCMISRDFPVSILEANDVIYLADFENTTGDNNWILGGGATDGNWTIGTPSPYTVNGIQLEIAAYEGSMSLLTGTGNSQDLDGGPTISRSPAITLPDSSILDLRYYYSYYSNASEVDYFHILLKRDADDTVLDTLTQLNASSTGQEAIWSHIVRDLSIHTGVTVYIEAITEDIPNQSKIEAAIDQIMISTRNTCSCDTTYYDSFVYDGCGGDGYSTIINGVIYNENNPSGIERLRTAEGCDSLVSVSLNFDQNYQRNMNYVGCEGDGYMIIVNGVIYNESNPIGQENMTSASGCDSIINVDLSYNPKVVVEAGMLPYAICSGASVDLLALGADISGGTNAGQWSTMGDGTFDLNGIFNISGTATEYQFGPQDIDNGKVILTLTSTDPPGPCEPAADAVLILINDIRCSEFPWAGN